MDMKKLAPWNWFKKEHENADKTIPVRRDITSSEVSRVPDHPLHRFYLEVDRLFEDMFRGFGRGEGLREACRRHWSRAFSNPGWTREPRKSLFGFSGGAGCGAK